VGNFVSGLGSLAALAISLIQMKKDIKFTEANF